MITSVTRLPDDVDRTIGELATRNRTIGELATRTVTEGLMKDAMGRVRQMIDSESCSAWSIQFDGWDWSKKNKILGASLRLVLKDGSSLCLKNFPFCFWVMRGYIAGVDVEADEANPDQIGVCDEIPPTPVFQTIESLLEKYFWSRYFGSQLHGSKDENGCGEALWC